MKVLAEACGRVELLGNHTDYNSGLVLALGWPERITVSATPRPDGILRVFSERFAAEASGPLAKFRPFDGELAWANAAFGVAALARRRGLGGPGADLVIGGDLPAGAGLASSAAVAVAVAQALGELDGWTLPVRELAELCREAETDFSGVPCGLLDPLCCGLGRPGEILLLDFRTATHERLPLPAGWTFTVHSSAGAHELACSAYATRRQECEEAARRLGVATLRAVSAEAEFATLPELLRRRVQHIYGENARVLEGVSILRAGGRSAADAAQFGALLNASHESSRSNFENSTPALDVLARRLRAEPGVQGARLTGGGFGGSVLALRA